jgi:DnaJ like chaperone protein
MEMILVFVALMFVYLISKSFMSYEAKGDKTQAKKNEKHQSSSTDPWKKPATIVEDDTPSPIEIEAGLIVALMSKVASADGKVCDIEKELISNMLYDFASNFMDHKRVHEILKEIFEAEKNNLSNVSKIATQVFETTKYEYNKRIKILEYLLNLAFIDKNFSSAEQDTIELIAEVLKIKDVDFNRIFDTFNEMYANEISAMSSTLEEAYKTLSIDSDNKNADIKKRYRELIKRHHPDLATGKGLGDEDVKKATIKIQEINEAYEVIKKDRGI